MSKLHSHCVLTTINILFVQGQNSWLEHYISFTVSEVPQQNEPLLEEMAYMKEKPQIFFYCPQTKLGHC